MRKKSIKEIAELAGVSKTTVSLVINGKAGKYRISPATVKKVEKIVRGNKFVPSKSAQNFRKKITKSFALITPNIRDPLFVKIAENIERVSSACGYNMVLYRWKNDQKSNNGFLSGQLDGHVLFGDIPTDEVRQLIDIYGKPVVCVNKKMKAPESYWVTSDEYKNAFHLTHHFIKSGIRKIAYIGSNTKTERFLGYFDALESNGILFDPEMVCREEIINMDGYESAKLLLVKHQDKPQVILVESHPFLIGLLRFLHETRYNPGLIKIGSFDDDPMLDFISFAVDSVRQDYKKIGETAFNILLRAMKGEKGIRNKEVPSGIIVRSRKEWGSSWFVARNWEVQRSEEGLKLIDIKERGLPSP